MTIGDRIEKLRKTKEVTQVDLASMIGASRESIGKYERDEMQPSLEVAKRIADALDATVDYLVAENPMQSFDKKTLKRFKEIENLPPEERDFILKVIDGLLRDAKAKKAYS